MRAANLLLLCLLLAACTAANEPVGANAPVDNPPTGGGGDDADDAPAFRFPHATGRLLVMMREPDEVDEIEELREDFAGLSIERIGESAFFILQVGEGVDLAQVLEELEGDARVILSEPDYLAESPEGDPSDIPILGGDVVASIAPQPGLRPLDLASASAIATGAGVVVAVVDTGVDPTHPALQGRLESNGFDFIDQDFDPTDERNFIDDDGDGVVDEQFGHGTFIASLVLAVAPDARILPVRVLDAEGFGTSSTLAAGIVWAVDSGADVINLSIGVAANSEAVREAIGYATDRDVLLVAAAGNDAADRIVFPASESDVLGVAAVAMTGAAAGFSNVGSAVDLVAPGVSMLGAMPETINPAGTGTWSGTSFAAPAVAGSAALVRSVFPALDSRGVTERMQDTALPVDAANPGLEGKLGTGLVQPAAALQP